MTLLWMTILVILMASVTGVEARSKCSSSCKCYPKTETAICGKYKPGIKRVPSVPGYVRRYTFTNGDIPVLNRSALSPVANNSLLLLALINDSIKVLSEDVFADFQKLQMLDLSGNIIAVNVLTTGFRSLGYELRNIILGKMNIANIPHDLLETNKSLHVEKLSYRENSLAFFDDTLFHVMPSLMHLDLAFNQISTYQNHYENGMPNLRKLQLSHNSLREIPNFCWPNGTIRYGRLESLDVSSNAIRSLESFKATCIRNIKKIVLDGNRLTVLPNNIFSNLHQLVTLYLSNMKYLQVIEEFAFNSTSLTKLRFENNVKLKPKMFPGKLPFVWAPKLSEFSLMGTRILLPLHLLKSLLLQLKSVRNLNLQRTRINTIPPGTLGLLNRLKVIDLQGNYISKWHDDAFKNVSHIDYLNMDGNRISIINETSFPGEFRTTIRKINLGNNDYLCDCRLLWFRTWMKAVIRNKTVKFVNYPHKYFCKNPSHIRLDKFNPTAESCKVMSPYIIPFLSSGSIVLVAVIISAIVYWHRWDIRYWMYMWNRRPRYRQLPEDDMEYKYDAFVSFDSNDSEWMMEKVANFVENELNRKLCIHERDFTGGKMIFDNISECMEDSERIIIVVSNNFARSNWCKCEVKMAITQKFETGKDVMLVVREMVDRKYMFKSLKSLMNTTTYIEWNEDENAKYLFKTRLAEFMGDQHPSV